MKLSNKKKRERENTSTVYTTTLQPECMWGRTKNGSVGGLADPLVSHIYTGGSNYSQSAIPKNPNS